MLALIRDEKTDYLNSLREEIYNREEVVVDDFQLVVDLANILEIDILDEMGCSRLNIEQEDSKFHIKAVV